jgi:hypothetical protein
MLAGVYVPGGTAVLPSSALMLAVPAQIAGCSTVVLATPPRPDGSITPEVLYCAKKAGVTHILKAGGAQAVAAMAWGTQTCPKVSGLILTAAAAAALAAAGVCHCGLHQQQQQQQCFCDSGSSPAVYARQVVCQHRGQQQPFERCDSRTIASRALQKVAHRAGALAAGSALANAVSAIVTHLFGRLTMTAHQQTVWPNDPD